MIEIYQCSISVGLYVMWTVYKHGIQICSARDFSVFLTACCVTGYDRTRFIADVREAVLEVVLVVVRVSCSSCCYGSSRSSSRLCHWL